MPYRDPVVEELDEELSKSMRTLFIGVIIALIIFVLLTGKSFAHEGVEGYPCATKAVRATWGAEARFKGAPSMIKYTPMEKVKEFFFKHNAPEDGIYVADELSGPERIDYIKAVLYGWEKADSMIKKKKWEKFDNTYLVAYFLNECRKQNE